MAENVYDGLFILDATKFGGDVNAVGELVKSQVEKFGGELLVSRLWEERRLAYPINGQRKGIYWLSYFRLNTQKMVELERSLQLTDSVLRFLFVKLDPKIVEVLVKHANEGTFYAHPTDGKSEHGIEDAVGSRSHSR